MPLSGDLTVRNLFLRACGNNDLNKVQSLLDLDADVNWRDRDGKAALHFAAGGNYGELLELLLA